MAARKKKRLAQTSLFISIFLYKMKKLFLIRHGQTDGNVALRYYGHTDIMLNERGREQASGLAIRLSHEPLDRIYSSDLARAYETARIIARGHGLDVQRSRRLREIDLGDWEGLTFEEIKARDEELVRQWMVEFETHRMPNGESVAEFRSRVEYEIKNIIAKNRDQTVAIVTHGGVTRMVLCYLLGWDLSSFWHLCQDTGCLNVIDLKSGKPSLLLLNSREVR